MIETNDNGKILQLQAEKRNQELSRWMEGYENGE